MTPVIVKRILNPYHTLLYIKVRTLLDISCVIHEGKSIRYTLSKNTFKQL